MKTFNYWLKAILGDVVFVGGLAVLWKRYGLQGAGDVLIFFLWAVTVMRTLIGLMPKSSHAEFAEKMPVRPRFFGFYHACTEILILTFIVWHGYIGLAVCYLIALMLYEGTRERIVKLKAAA